MNELPDRASGVLSLLARFQSKVMPEPNTGCWIWTACLNGNGYGSINVSKGRAALAHRVSYELHKGKIPKGLCALHTCDNTWCVNPDHLFLGTIQDNVKDRDHKNRVQHGQTHFRAKVEKIHIGIIKEAVSLGFPRKEIAKYFRLSKTGLQSIITNKHWKR